MSNRRTDGAPPFSARSSSGGLATHQSRGSSQPDNAFPPSTVSPSALFSVHPNPRHDPRRPPQEQFHFHLHSHPQLHSHSAPVPRQPPTTSTSTLSEAPPVNLNIPAISLHPDAQSRWLHQSSLQTVSSTSPPTIPATSSEAVQPASSGVVLSSTFFDPPNANTVAEYQQPIVWDAAFQTSFQYPSSQGLLQAHRYGGEYPLEGYNPGEIQFVHLHGQGQQSIVESQRQRTQSGNWYYDQSRQGVQHGSQPEQHASQVQRSPEQPQLESEKVSTKSIVHQRTQELLAQTTYQTSSGPRSAPEEQSSSQSRSQDQSSQAYTNTPSRVQQNEPLYQTQYHAQESQQQQTPPSIVYNAQGDYQNPVTESYNSSAQQGAADMSFYFGSGEDVFYDLQPAGQELVQSNSSAGLGISTATGVHVSHTETSTSQQAKSLSPSAPFPSYTSPANTHTPAGSDGGAPPIFSLTTQPHAHPHPHPSSHSHSHSSHSPASYASYATTGSSVEYPTTGSSAESFPTTGSSMVEYPPAGERSGSASGPASVSGSTSSGAGLEAAQGGAGLPTGTTGIVHGHGHGNSASVSTVTGSSVLETAHGRSKTATGEPAQQAVSGNRPGHNSARYAPLARAPAREHGQTQMPSHQPRHSHQLPRAPIHQQGQISGKSHPHGEHTVPTVHASVFQSTQSQGQYAAPVLPPSSTPIKAGTSGTTTTAQKRGRAPKRLRASLTGPPVGVGKSAPAGIGGGGEDNSEDDSEDDEGDWEPISGSAGDGGPSGGPGASRSGHGGTGVPGGRKAGACTHCKRLKMKCEFPEGATSCKRCTNTGHPCIVEGRKPRIVPNKREYLLAQIRHKDQIIESLLKQLHNPYVATPLSISAFQMATSPSDKDNVRIVDWMDRLQSSTRPPTQPCPSRMKMLHELRDPHGSSGGAVDTIMDDSDDTDDVDETTEGEDTENMRSTLPDAAVPIGLLANLSLDKDVDKGKSKSRQGSGSGSTRTKPADGDENVGVANKEYFMPGPANNLSIRKNLIEKHSPPDIVLHGLVTADDVEKLFEIFWNDINPFISLLDRKLHSPSTIFQRCPFLFTVICAVSSRYYNAKSDIYPVAMHFAKHSAANALTDGWKSLELCQAYILLSIYTVPARKWEEDRSWLYTGLAIRIATDLNLHQVPSLQSLTERQEREILNRTRVWMICFNLDRSTATQFGKQSTIKEDYIIRNSADWYKKSQYRDKYDLHLCAYTALLRIVAQFHDNIFSDPDSPTGLNKSIDFLAVTSKHDDHLTSYSEEWTRRFHEESDRTDPGSDFRCTLLPFLVNYSRLVMYSFGFQHAFQRGMEASDHVFLKKCFESATKVIKHMIEVLAPTGYMRSSPDGHFIFASFASAFLLKLLRPEFAQLLTREMEDEIFDLIGRLITTLQDLAIDERHTPHLYARFLASLLTKHRKGGAGVGGHTRPQPPTSQLVHQSGQPHGYLGPQHTPSSRMQYSGSSSKDSSQPRYDNDTMQMNPGPLPSTSRTPPPTTTTPMPITNTPPPDFVHSQSSFPLVSGSVDPVTTDTVIDDMLSEVGSLATMYVLNDAWWGNMMMPGFTWSDAPEMSNVDDGPHAGVPNTYYPGFTGFLAPETQVAM